MSKLAEKIRRATRLQSQGLGFVSSRADGAATIVLAGVAKDAKAAAEVARRGADVVIVGSRESAASIGDAVGEIGAVPGAWIAGKGDDEGKQYREAGYDFVVFDPNKASATSVLEEGIGYVLRLPDDLSDMEIRALEGFHLDAIHVGKIEGVLTVRRQIDLQRLYALTRKPLMAAVPADIPAGQLRALRDANVSIVAVEGAEGVEKLRQTIDGLPARARRKDDERPTPLVPMAASAGEMDDDDD
ncbi:MAG: hypothetical protein WEC75_06080 [Dehalococcoidia bacterium]